MSTTTQQMAKNEMLDMIRRHGARGAIRALSDALRTLGPDWALEDGPADGIEVVTSYSPQREDDWRGAAEDEQRRTLWSPRDGLVVERDKKPNGRDVGSCIELVGGGWGVAVHGIEIFYDSADELREAGWRPAAIGGTS